MQALIPPLLEIAQGKPLDAVERLPDWLAQGYGSRPICMPSSVSNCT